MRKQAIPIVAQKYLFLTITEKSEVEIPPKTRNNTDQLGNQHIIKQGETILISSPLNLGNSLLLKLTVHIND